MNIHAIRAAAGRLDGVARVTPLIWAPGLDAQAGRRVWVKAENLQLTGSFKFRGAWSALTALSATERARGVLACSSGNHAQGIALAARMLGVTAVIVMPADAPAAKIDATRGFGAEVVLYDRLTGDRDAISAAVCAERGLTLIPPYDHPDVIAGQGTVGLEIAAQARAAGVSTADVLCCCGGGGLSAGVALALAADAPGLRLRTVEPAGFDDMARSLATGQRVVNAARGGSICDAILTPTPGRLTLPLLTGRAGPGLSATDDQALAAMEAAFRHLRIVLEPGGAVGLAAALFCGDQIAGDQVIAVASGGNVDAAVFRRAL